MRRRKQATQRLSWSANGKVYEMAEHKVARHLKKSARYQGFPGGTYGRASRARRLRGEELELRKKELEQCP